MERTSKNDRKIKILNGHETGKEGTSRGDTTTNLRNFSSRFFLVRAKKLEKPTLGRLGRRHKNSGPGSHDNFSEKVENHENRPELDPYSTNRAENQAI